jgi:hypothetical protein
MDSLNGDGYSNVNNKGYLQRINQLYLLIGVLLTWRLIFGGMEMYGNNETFTTIGFPRWISFPYATICLSLLIMVCLYTFGRSIAEGRANRFFDESLNHGGPEIHGEH